MPGSGTFKLENDEQAIGYAYSRLEELLERHGFEPSCAGMDVVVHIDPGLNEEGTRVFTDDLVVAKLRVALRNGEIGVVRLHPPPRMH